MVDNAEHSKQEELRGASVQVLATDPVAPEGGRIFVWTKMGWFERLEGDSGNVAFAPAAESEEELRELVSRDNALADLHELGGRHKKKVIQEFMSQSRSRSDVDSGVDSMEDDSSEDDQEYHQHGH